MAKAKIETEFARLESFISRLPAELVKQSSLKGLITKATNKFFDAYKERWYDSPKDKSYSTTDPTEDLDGAGFAKRDKYLWNHIELKQIGFSLQTAGRGNAKYKVPYTIVYTGDLDRRPLRDKRETITADKAAELRFFVVGHAGIISTPSVTQFARTKGMDRWMSDRFSKTVGGMLGDRVEEYGMAFRRVLLNERMS